MGFEEIRHTADWALRVWASNLSELLSEAARGMYTLSGAQLEKDPRVSRRLELDAADAESLLVSFLSELLYISESENLGFDRFTLKIDAFRLKADLSGAPLEALTKQIKAVTYHNLQIRRTDRGLETEIVFDV